MLSIIFLMFAAVHLGIWIWGWRRWAQVGKPVGLLLVLISSTLLFYDNMRIGLGRFIGEGPFLEAMTVPAFAWHWTLLPLLIIAVGSMARSAGLGWAMNKIVMGAFCVVAVGLSAHDIPKIFDLELHPACIADTLRYTTNVSEAALCDPSDSVVTRGPGAALVAIITNVIVLAVGIALWIQRGWPWLALGSGAMFIAAGAFATSPWSLPIANFGEVFITLGLILTGIRFAPGRSEQAPDAVAQQT